MADRFRNNCNNHNQQSPTDSTNNTPKLNPYSTLLYIGISSIKFGKGITALFRDRLDTGLKIAQETFTIMSNFNVKYPLSTLFCSNVVNQCTCSCDKNMSYIGMTTRQLFVRRENHLSNNQSFSNFAIKFHCDQCKACTETVQQSKT